MSLAAVFQIGSLGDSILSLPAVRSLRELLPDCSDYILISPTNSSSKVSPNEVFSMVWKPKYQAGYFASANRLKRSASLASLFVRLRFLRPRYGIGLMPANRSSIQTARDRLFFRAAGIKELIGFEPSANANAPPTSAEFTGTEAFIRFKRLWGNQAEEKYPAYAYSSLLNIPSAAHSTVNSWLTQNRRFPARPLLAVCPFSNWSSKDISPATMARVLTLLVENRLAEPIILGGAKDRAAASAILNDSQTSGLNGCGVFSTVESAALLTKSNLAVCADSGPMHLAGALDIPTVSIFSRVAPSMQSWFPLGREHTILYREVPCAGCDLVACKFADHPCLSPIGADEIFSAVRSKLAGLPVAEPYLGDTRILNWSRGQSSSSPFVLSRPA